MEDQERQTKLLILQKDYEAKLIPKDVYDQLIAQVYGLGTGLFLFILNMLLWYCTNHFFF